MLDFQQHKIQLEENGFSITEAIFSHSEVECLKELIEKPETYAVRQLLNKHPQIKEKLFENKKFQELVKTICGTKYFITKGIYFNKPAQSNWFVGYHQDISISAKNKIVSEGYTNWTNKKGQLGVIPPPTILEQTVTIRIHLDDTDETNGALKVIPKSHKNGIIRVDQNFTIKNLEKEVVCKVKKGSVMLMKPLLLHASSKSTAKQDRGVIHIELCNEEIPMQWLEKKKII
ncbi:Phytanoyl-CoA dioxygenase [Tenacibaculum sp. 190524A02b]|uniref:Phytanoyl-CoA dioxygenase n=1 Tax=Tenacibaculum vairaonense TaxID=3137860 RepID=A0ABM9PHG9_9FLAO